MWKTEPDQENVGVKTLSLFVRRRQDTSGNEGATEREKRLTTREPKYKRMWEEMESGVLKSENVILGGEMRAEVRVNLGWRVKLSAINLDFLSIAEGIVD